MTRAQRLRGITAAVGAWRPEARGLLHPGRVPPRPCRGGMADNRDPELAQHRLWSLLYLLALTTSKFGYEFIILYILG